MPELRPTHEMDQSDEPPSQQELVARTYNDKIMSLARAAAERMGRPYKAKEVNLDQLVTDWDTKDPEVDEQKAWQDALENASRALDADPTLDKQDVLDELPIVVASKVYPKRMDVLKAMGGTSYADWVRDADKIEKMAAERRAKQAREQPSPPPLSLAAPEPAVAPLPEPMAPPMAPVPPPAAPVLPPPGPLPAPALSGVSPGPQPGPMMAAGPPTPMSGMGGI